MGRVKVKVKHIHIQEKAKLKKQKLNRRKKRVEKEQGPSKYPEGYINDPMGSIMSNYDPIVGEVNYLQAVLPQPVVQPPPPLKQEEEK